jgi:thioredoxin reductase (NADPH)
MLAEHGEEKTAAVGDVLFEVGDAVYPFIAIREGETAILDATGRELVRHGPSGFLGEMNLLSGQTVFLTAVVTEPLRYVEVDRETLRGLLFEDGVLSDTLLSAFVQRRESLQRVEGVGIEIVGPTQDHATRDLVEYAKRQRLPYSWRDPGGDAEAAALVADLAPEEIPLVRLPGGIDLRRPSNGELSRALGIGLELAPREEVDLLIVGGGPAGLGAAVYGASEGLNTLVVESNVLGGQAGTSRRIEKSLGFPAGLSGNEEDSRALAQAR